MLYHIYAMTIKDLKILLKDRAGMAILFLMPAMFILVMSVALKGVFEPGGNDTPVRLLVVNQDRGNLAAQAISDLEALKGLEIVQEVDGRTLNREEAERLIVDGDYRVALVFPPDFTDRVERSATDEDAGPAEVFLIADPASSTSFLAPIRGTIVGIVERRAEIARAGIRIEASISTAASKLPPEQATALKEIGRRISKAMAEDSSIQSSWLKVEVVAPAEFRVKRFPNSVEQNVPGYTIFGVFFIVQTLATSLLREKQEGTFRRLLAAPISKSAILLGKLLPCYLVTLIQVTLMFGIGVVAFHMGLGHAPGALVAVTLATGLAATGLGLMVAALGKTPEQVGGLSSLLVLTMAALGGSMVPTFVMPRFMQVLSRLTPHAWALEGYQNVIVRGLGFSSVVPDVAALLGFAAVFFGVALWRFRFD